MANVETMDIFTIFQKRGVAKKAYAVSWDEGGREKGRREIIGNW